MQAGKPTDFSFDLRHPVRPRKIIDSVDDIKDSL